MSRPQVAVITSLGLVLMATPVPALGEPDTRQQVEALARRRVFFAHQSVGTNILNGLRLLAEEHGVPLRISELQRGGGAPANTIGHQLVPENGDPLRKLRAFVQAFESGTARGADVALIKFCYVDVGSETDARALFETYQTTLKKLQAAYPETAFVHVTVPLTTVLVQDGIKGTIKRALGMTPYVWGHIQNARREEYNALLRDAYVGKEPVFDLALLESTAPDRSRTTIEWNGRTVPVMVPAYTDDGGHLNVDAQARAARELLVVLLAATSSGSRTPRTPAP